MLCCFATYGLAQGKTLELSGQISDAENAERLIGATVLIKSNQKGTSTDTKGFYSFEIPSGQYTLEFSYVGYKSIEKTIQLNADRKLNIELKPSSKVMDEVKVEGENPNKNTESTEMGRIQLDMEKIKKLPAFMGEADVIKSIRLLPGVQSAGEGNQGFYVRGGGPGQNLILLDHATVYNASHLFGLFSIFNGDAIKEVELIKGGMPAEYGSRLSSVLDIKMRSGSDQRWGFNGGIGLISSRLTVEGPIVKDKASIIVSARRTYVDLYTKTLIPDDSPFKGSGYYFYDLNLKAEFNLSDKDKLSVSGYHGRDVFNYKNEEDEFDVNIPWGNTLGSIRWNHIFSDKLSMEVAGTFSNYNFSFESQQDGFEFKLLSGVLESGIDVDFIYRPNPRHEIKFGVDYNYHIFTPSSVSARSDSTDFNTGEIQKIHAQTEAIYIRDDFDITDWLKVNAGLRYSLYQQTGPYTKFIKSDVGVGDSTINYKQGELVEFYHGLEPRLAARFKTGANSSIKTDFTYNYQYIHLASISSVSLPTDVWFPSTQRTKPQRGWQLSAGYFQNFLDNKFIASVELYYKDLQNTVAYEEGALPQETVKDNVDNQLTYGRGYSYGAEFFLKKRLGKLNGWIGYTWSKTERQFDQLNDGKWFPAKYDRRHDLSVVASYDFNEQWSVGAKFVYATGNTLTVPTGRYFLEGNIINEYGERNGFRMPAYHRLDVSMTWSDKKYKLEKDPETGDIVKKKNKFRNSVNVSIYNVYNRANPYFIYLDNEGSINEGSVDVTAKQVSLFPIIPSVTWNFEF